MKSRSRLWIALIAGLLVAATAATAYAAYALVASRWYYGTGTYVVKSRIASGDVNADGKADVVNLYDRGLGKAYLFGYKSNGTSAFTRATMWSGTLSVPNSQIAAGDYDGDGDDDVFVLYNVGNNTSRVYLMTSNGTSFSNPTILWQSATRGMIWSKARISAGDSDGDGKANPIITYEPAYGRTSIYTLKAPGGSVAGLVLNANTGAVLSGIGVTIHPASGADINTTTRSDGTFSVSLAPGTYTASFFATDFIPADYGQFVITTNQNRALDTIRLVPMSLTGTGSGSGRVTNALTGIGVGGLNLLVREGYNQTTGATVPGASAVTASDGTYSFSGLDAGYYTAEVTGTGYITTFFEFVVFNGALNQNQNAVITPTLAAGQTRIVLTWGATPNDLDTHFTGPIAGSSSRFHVYFSSKKYPTTTPYIAELDLDDTSAFGPETTTLHTQVAGGLYRYSIFDYSNQSASSTTAMSNSGAQVKVYQGSGLVATFNIPRGVGGDLWTVFEMRDGVITTINRVAYTTLTSGSIP